MTTLEERAARSAPEVLTWSRSLLDPALRQAVSDLPQAVRQIAEYHFGWDTAGGPGKALRPALVLVSAEAVGGSAGAALPGAVAVELVHNFSLLHDDVMDADQTRRHRPTAWRIFGVNQAILAGDALLALAFKTLCFQGIGTSLLERAVQHLIDGQSADLAFEKRNDVGLGECLLMAQRKTGALLSCSCALGGLLGGGTMAQIEHLASFGERLGLAFQVVDDMLGIWGDPAVTGKPVFSDLRSRKKTLPVIAALSADNPAGRALAALYRRDDKLSRGDLANAARLVEEAGGRRWSLAQIDEQLSRALEHLRVAGLGERAVAELDALARLATHRDF
ncbi:polyprenyl synthetase family protein [Allorhizocola rhizosphaerae]|uniref:polyprenyl synthetase family protein n=1 Tax=Allorhizocola rhizosphaerae TaxID=1872709 RepID=UPI000E3E1AB7|nr:polyprenyl synthetase family protein [Allorhizocola rhizosphaerae]